MMNGGEKRERPQAPRGTAPQKGALSSYRGRYGPPAVTATPLHLSKRQARDQDSRFGREWSDELPESRALSWNSRSAHSGHELLPPQPRSSTRPAVELR